MNRSLRYLLVLLCLAQLALAVGLLLHIPRVTGLWPLPYTTTMSYTFLASIAFAAAGSTLWCVVMDELAAMAGVALDLVAIFTPLSILAFQLSHGVNRVLLRFGVWCVVLIAPFLRRLPSVAPGLRANLIVYLAVVSLSALLAVYYLFVHPPTRLGRRVRPAAG